MRLKDVDEHCEVKLFAEKPILAAVEVSLFETWSAGGKDFNILIAFTSKLIRDSTLKQGEKGDIKCVQQDGISILEFCFPPCSNTKFQIRFTIRFSFRTESDESYRCKNRAVRASNLTKITF